MYVITNGTLVLPDHLLTHHSVLLEGEVIQAIIPDEKLPKHFPGKVIDAAGGFIMPGFIDMHSDYIEQIAAPRPTSLMDFELALYEAERELLTHGITTMYHSLSLMGSGTFDEKPIRNSENVVKLLQLIHDSNYKHHLIHHRMHLRFEIDNFEQVELAKELMSEDKVQLFSIMDHTPGQGQYRDLEKYRLILAGYHDGDYQVVDNLVTSSMNSERLSHQEIESLSACAGSCQIPLASHDDDTLEKLDYVESLGAKISEFPITLEVAQAARAKGMFTVGGAPNILLGRSHAGNLSVKEGVAAGAISILCSDYYPAALLHGVFQLWQEGILPLNEAVNLVTQNPAQALELSEVGRLEVGKMADLIVVQVKGHLPMVTQTFVKGVLVNETTYRLSRM